MKLKSKALLNVTAAVILFVVVLLLGIFGGMQLVTFKDSKAEVITVSTLSKIVNISELSTYRTEYNGVATSIDQKFPDKVDYYVAYQATVEAGIDFSQTKIAVDSKNKTVVITLPEVTITDATVDPSTLDYIFVDKKAETASVSEQALKLCEADVAQETKSQDGILKLARQNALNVVEALTRPLVTQSDPDYTLTVQ